MLKVRLFTVLNDSLASVIPPPLFETEIEPLLAELLTLIGPCMPFVAVLESMTKAVLLFEFRVRLPLPPVLAPEEPKLFAPVTSKLPGPICPADRVIEGPLPLPLLAAA